QNDACHHDCGDRLRTGNQEDGQSREDDPSRNDQTMAETIESDSSNDSHDHHGPLEDRNDPAELFVIGSNPWRQLQFGASKQSDKNTENEDTEEPSDHGRRHRLSLRSNVNR